MKNLNVGVIGLGVGEQHIIGFLKSKHIRSISIFDNNKNKVKEIQKKNIL